MKKGTLSRLDFVPTVSNLGDKYKIKNPNDYIKKFRSSFLVWVREQKGLSKDDVAKSCGFEIKALERIEKGNVNESDLMNLQKLSRIYTISYPHLLSLFKLVQRQPQDSDVKVAAYHDPQMDEETIKKITEFIGKLMVEEKGKDE